MGYSFVTNQLAQGSAPPLDTRLPFEVLILTAMEWQPEAARFPGVVVVHCPLDDAKPSADEARAALAAARRAASALKCGNRVLVTCYAGRNRSGLVSGLALIECGYSSTDAVALIQHARRDALTNAHFREVLHARSRRLGRDSTAAFA